MVLVVDEDVARRQCGIFVIDEGVDFEVVLETAKIDVCRADSGEQIVRHHQFGVEEPSFVAEYLDACFKDELQVRR